MKNQWQHIKSIFSEALTLPKDKREEFIEIASGGNKEVIREVRSLLVAHDSPSLLDEDIGHIKEPVFKSLNAENLSHELPGKYQIIKRLGEGGMGTVFLAERADGEFEQQAALKIINSPFATQWQIDRFRTERQILASLKHPNIARLLDGGVTGNGLPYYVMDYVEGKPIDQFCQDNKLNLKERLNLFLEVCKAVEYAHQNLIVHRDIKPSNILVTADGNVKLLDFGIAKIVKDDISATRPDVNREGLIPLTPAYASPEQIKGDPITTHTDVYQLGVLLYQLLSGSIPIQTAGKTPGEIEYQICETAPELPSKAADYSSGSESDSPAQKVSHRLKGDLDTIVIMALRKEPEMRYSSVAQLADDIQNYLESRPVFAHPQSLSYRVRKLVKRRPFETAAILIFALILCGYAFTITWHSQKTGQALQQAQLEAEKSEQVVSFLMGMFEAGDPYESLGDTVTANVLLERGIGQASQLDDQPEIQAQMFDIVGRVYRELGEYDRAYPILQTALDLRNELNQHEEVELANTFYNLGTVMHHLGNYRESDNYFNRALEIYRQHPGLESREYAGSLFTNAMMLNVRRDFETAEQLHREALDMRLNLVGEDHPEVAASYYGLSSSISPLGRIDEAKELLIHALEIYQKTYGEFHPSTAETRVQLARVQLQSGEYTVAEANLRRALEIRLQVFGENHIETGMSRKALADFLADRGYFIAAEEIYLDLIKMIETKFENSHPLKRPVLQALGRMHLNNGKPEKAEPHLEETYQLISSVLNPQHPRVLSARLDYAICNLQLNQFDLAEELLTTNFEIVSDSDSENLRIIKTETLKALIELNEYNGNSSAAESFSELLSEFQNSDK
ncbi:MAG: tetratricopeptide repeat protein [Balneolaceae bacterium]|nr:tetratricopeptide repeat protein [Balneolaceae bacterium]